MKLVSVMKYKILFLRTFKSVQSFVYKTSLNMLDAFKVLQLYFS